MNTIRDDLTAFGFGGGGGNTGELVTRIETLEENVESLEDDIDKAFLQMTYSTQEHVVGEWINGSPIYSKTILIENPQVGSNYVSMDNNIDVIMISGWMKDINGGLIIIDGVRSATTDDSKLELTFDGNNNRVVLTVGAWLEGQVEAIINIYYIKTE